MAKWRVGKRGNKDNVGSEADWREHSSTHGQFLVSVYGLIHQIVSSSTTSPLSSSQEMLIIKAKQFRTASLLKKAQGNLKVLVV